MSTWSEEGECGRGAHTGENANNCKPALTHVLRGSKDETFKRGVERVDAMIEQLAQGAALSGSSS